MISASQLYTREALIDLLGMGNVTFRSLRDAGLPIIRLGRRMYFSGAQVIRFLEQYATRSDGETDDEPEE